MRLLIILAAFPALSLQQCLGEDDKLPRDPSVMAEILYKGEQQFSLNLLRQVNSRVGLTENIFFSPFSIYSALLLAYFVSSSHTEESIKKALFIPDRENKTGVAQAYKADKYFKSLTPPTKYELSYPNQLFVSNNLVIRDCMKTLFKDEITPLNFATDVTGATNRINSWIANGTKNEIKDLLKPGDLSPNTKLALVNAAFFKGSWKDKFPAESTRKELFYITSSEYALVPMMKHKSKFPFLASDELGAHVLEMPYDGDEVSMYVILPPFASPTGLTKVLERFTFENFHEIIETSSFYPRTVEVYFPKFEIEVELKELKESLESIGVGDLFKSTSDLSGLTGKPEIGLDTAIHKAKVKIDEEGTTAAATTVFAGLRSARPLEPVQFKCNHPFIYLIYDKTSKAILFMGVFNKPPQTE